MTRAQRPHPGPPDKGEGEESGSTGQEFGPLVLLGRREPLLAPGEHLVGQKIAAERDENRK